MNQSKKPLTEVAKVLLLYGVVIGVLLLSVCKRCRWSG